MNTHALSTPILNEKEQQFIINSIKKEFAMLWHEYQQLLPMTGEKNRYYRVRLDKIKKEIDFHTENKAFFSEEHLLVLRNYGDNLEHDTCQK